MPVSVYRGISRFRASSNTAGKIVQSPDKEKELYSVLKLIAKRFNKYRLRKMRDSLYFACHTRDSQI